MADMLGTFAVFPAIWLTNKLDFKNPDTLLYARIGYYTLQLSVFALLFYVYQLIQKNKDDTKIVVPIEKTMATKEGDPTEEEMTVQEYDIKMLKKMAQETLMPIFIMSLLHFKWNFNQPLVISLVTTPTRLIAAPLLKIYLMGKKDLARPFPKPPGPFDALTKAMEDMNPDDSKKKVKVDKKPKADEIKAIQEKNKKNAEGKDGDGELRQRKGKEAADADDDKDIPVIG
eukprot:TRINITY_DN2491_c1_g3_i3.p1 TRINITY_DN2491_c1_g3~~TRINITY_DN2491_c1_g3_i3.p1  ORF type:complete len:263 (-),score=82.03 TRINITY_DN2491_c1_g3_i3:196-882(-)